MMHGQPNINQMLLLPAAKQCDKYQML